MSQNPENDVQRPNAPFDLTVSPQTLMVTDSPGQLAALQAISYVPDSDTEDNTRFINERVHSKNLKYFRDIYLNRQKQLATGLLSRRMKIDFRTGDFVTPTHSNTIAWDMNQHFIDMMVCVGNGVGLGTIIPNQTINSLYEIHLNFNQPHRNFHTKYAKLGFNPKSSMLWIGKTPSSEDIWIAWVPDSVIQGEEEAVEEGNTALTEKHYRATIMFFAAMLSAIGYRDLIVTDKYPDLSSREEFLHASNIM
jgi:hypothetical protein